jgi:hypothetical protein
MSMCYCEPKLLGCNFATQHQVKNVLSPGPRCCFGSPTLIPLSLRSGTRSFFYSYILIDQRKSRDYFGSKPQSVLLIFVLQLERIEVSGTALWFKLITLFLTVMPFNGLLL